MNVFVPFAEPYKCAEAMINDQPRYNKQIVECKQILAALYDTSKAWSNHPAILQYRGYEAYIEYYLYCFTCRLNNIQPNDFNAQIPPFLTADFCDQHKRRLYTKSPLKYPQFAKYGTSEINFYFVDGELIKYKQGKRIE